MTGKGTSTSSAAKAAKRAEKRAMTFAQRLKLRAQKQVKKK